MKKLIALILCLCVALAVLAGCGTAANNTNTNTNTNANTNTNTNQKTDSVTVTEKGVSAVYTANTGGKLDTSNLFTERDLLQTPDLTSAVYLTAADGETLDITEAGVYVLGGSAANCTVRVEAGKEDKVQIVLNGADITNDSFPVIYVVQADKVFVTTAEGTQNTLSVTGKFNADGTVNTDAVIFSRDDLVLNGLGALTVESAYGNGVSGKDGIRITGGTYTVTAAEDGFEANDCIAVCGDTAITVTAGEDCFHAENDDDNTLGWILIADGTVIGKAGSDCIHAATVLQIDGGTLDLTGGEGLEATVVQINGGDITVSATDDGINAGAKSKAFSVLIEITGGTVNVTVGQGDTDAIDSNGDIVVSGGTVIVTTPNSSFDYDGAATYTGGTIIINGQQVDSIPQSMVPGGNRRR